MQITVLKEYQVNKVSCPYKVQICVQIPKLNNKLRGENAITVA
jgi:hypothetical protein